MHKQLILCGTALLVLFVLHVQSTEHGGGESGPIIIKSTGRKGRYQDLFMIGAQTKCGSGPTLIKSGDRKRRHGNDMILLGGSNHCHKKKTEYVPVPYPVKETIHVPVPYKETVHVPVHVPVHIPVPVKEEMSYGKMEMGGYGGGGGGDMGGYGGGDMGGGYGGGY